MDNKPSMEDLLQRIEQATCALKSVDELRAALEALQYGLEPTEDLLIAPVNHGDGVRVSAECAAVVLSSVGQYVSILDNHFRGVLAASATGAPIVVQSPPACTAVVWPDDTWQVLVTALRRVDHDRPKGVGAQPVSCEARLLELLALQGVNTRDKQ